MRDLRGLIGQRATRAAPLPEGTLDAEARTFELALASEYAVKRYHWDLGDFDEVLLCGAENVDLARLAPEAGGPLLMQHDHSAQIGVIDSARVDSDRVVRAVARAQRSPAGDQLLTDIADRVRRNVSVGYHIVDVELHEKEGQRPRVVVTRWQPFEASIVASGADPTAGIGRSPEQQYPDAIVRALRSQRKGPTVDDDPKITDAQLDVKVSAAREDARKAEQLRIREITAIGKAHRLVEEAAKAVDTGTEVEEFRSLALGALEKRQQDKSQRSTLVDLPNQDRQRYSLGRAVQALMTGDRSKAGLEQEVTEAYVKAGAKLQRADSFYVPLRYLAPRDRDHTLREALAEKLGLRAAVSKGGSGGNLVMTEHWDEEYVPHLLSDLVVVKAGVRVLPGVIGDIDIPAGDGSYGTAAHIATETTDAGEVAPALKQISGSPHTIAAYTDFTRRMRLQSLPAIEAIVRTGLSDAINELVERSVLNGSGSGGAPTGVYGTSGVVASDFGAGPSFTYRDFIDMWAAIKGAKGTSARLGYITSYAVAAKAMTVTRGGTGSDIMIATMGADANIRIDGFPLWATQESPQAFGSPPALHGVAFGDWSKIVIPQWGEGIEINIDEAALALKGGRRVIAFFDYDVLVTLNKSFAIADDVSVA